MSQRLQNISTQMEIILSAIYMATGHMSDENTLKQSLRSSALQVMAETIELVGDENVNTSIDSGRSSIISGRSIETLKSSIKVNIYKTMSFIKVLKSERMMSDNNADLLIMTYKKLLSFINDYQPIGLYVVTDSIKDIDYGIYTDMSDSRGLYNLNNNYLTEASSFNKREKQIQNNNLNSNDKDLINNSNVHTNDVKSNRRTHILDIIKGGAIDGHNMSEILTKIKEVNDTELKTISEKTVQRELNTMIEQGLIVKKGEKRWSRYILSSKLL